jgi:large subunit ribosomal protein L23
MEELNATDIIKAPLISEKTTFLAASKNAYSFEVDKTADKAQIKKAIEFLYKVKVLAVRTQRVPGKSKRTRSGFKSTGEWKKEIVELHPDNKLDLF